jgi:hypothetical protein
VLGNVSIKIIQSIWIWKRSHNFDCLCLGSVASKDYPSILHAMNAMNQIGKIVNPTDSIVVKNYHSAK